MKSQYLGPESQNIKKVTVVFYFPHLSLCIGRPPNMLWVKFHVLVNQDRRDIKTNFKYMLIYSNILCSCAQLCLTLCGPMDCVAHQAPLSMRFSRHEYWRRLPYSSPGDLPDLGIKHASPVSCIGRQILRFFTTEPPGKLILICRTLFCACFPLELPYR